MSLNIPQNQAVTHRGSALLVLAGAGTGKTRVITHRIEHLVKSGVPAHRILAVTFTNKAAREMRERLDEMKVPEEIWVGTFHAIGMRILRYFPTSLGYTKNFTVCDDDAQKSLIKALLADTKKGKSLSENLVAHYISQLKGEGKSPQEVRSHDSIVPQSFQTIIQEVYERYEEGLKRSNTMDFADLLLNTVKLLRTARGTPAERLLTKFEYVLVDEFQDTNRIQMEMTDLLATSGEICVVGDDDQSVYSWRGADPRGMIAFAKRPGTVVVKLEDNYRCTTPILDCANSVIAHNSNRLGKSLRTTKQGEPVRITLSGTERDEANQVALRIKQPYQNHAVLYRTHAQSRAIEEALRRSGIPYTIIGGLRFYDRAEIKDLLAYYRLATNPKSDMDLLRIANKPARGLSDKKMGALKTLAAKKEISLFEALQESKDSAAQSMVKIIHTLSEKVDNTNLKDFHKILLKTSAYRDALVHSLESTKSESVKERARQQIDNVDELSSDITTYQDDHPKTTVEKYLDHVSLLSSIDKRSGPSVPLMTIHAAKGLEFEHVHLVGFEEGLLPHTNALSEEERKGAVAIEEERRLCYVALTRARTQLDINFAKLRTLGGSSTFPQPSRFLDELDLSQCRKIGF